MTWADSFRTAYEAILARRMRSVLTMLGILIGIAAVMLTVGLGQGAQERGRQRHQRPRLQPAHRHTREHHVVVRFPGRSGSATTLTMGDAQMLANPTIAPDVAAVAPASTSNQALAAGSQTWTSSVVGTTPTWLSVRARTVTEGRFFTEADQAAGNTVAVLGATTASELFTGNPIGQTVTINSAQFTVIGILDTQGELLDDTSTTRWSSR